MSLISTNIYYFLFKLCSLSEFLPRLQLDLLNYRASTASRGIFIAIGADLQVGFW